MNILQILPELNYGGVERGTVDLAKQLIALGHKSIVVSNGGNLVADLEKAGVIHYKLPVHKKGLINIIKQIPNLAGIIEKEKIDIVHARSRVPAWIAFFACRRRRCVLITTCHGYYRQHFFSYVMGWAKRVIVPSNVIARHMIEDFGVPYDRIRLIPRSVDLEKFKYSDPAGKRQKEFNVGIIGRMTPIKGHLDFIKAMAKIYRTNPRLKIWIVGDAPSSKDAYKEQVKVLVRRLGLDHCTVFLGAQKDIPEILSRLDLLILATTTQEAFGRVIIEAHACGVPVVATAVGGVIDIIENEKTGLIIPPSDPQAMADAALKILHDKSLAKYLAENAYKKVREKYNLELMVKSTVEVYEEALKAFRILVIKFSSVGDVILSTAALKSIRQKFGPDYSLVCLTSEPCKDILLRCQFIDELLVCDFKGKDRGAFGLLKLAKVLRKINFDIVIDLQNNRKSHLLSYMSLALDRFGYDNKKFGFLLNHRIKDTKDPIDPVSHQFRILKMLDIEKAAAQLEMCFTRHDQEYVEDFLKSEWLSKNQKIIGLNISASKRWSTKVWPMSQMIKLCEELNRKDLIVGITGTSDDLDMANTLIKSMHNAKVINTCGKFTINQLACFIRKCSVYITGDSAPMHVAAAVRVPFVALFGPTDPRRHLPPSDRFIVIKKDLACSPCYKSECRNLKCMKSITANEVLSAVESLIEGKYPEKTI